MAARKLRILGLALVALTLPCGSAFAAPPADPPGKSGDAPGHNKDEGSPAEPTTPPGHAESEAAAPQAAPAADTAPQAGESHGQQGPVESPRFENAAGKPKHNVPAAAEAAPETSVSAPGASGRHKVTICHKGHAITVDVHAARAHIDGHGDTYAVAGAKGRAACPQPSGSTTPPTETPSGPGAVRPDLSAAAAKAGRESHDPGVAPAVVADPHVTPTGGVSEDSHEHGVAAATGSGVAAAVAGGALPFTGAQLWVLVLFGLGLVAGGLLLLRVSAPARARHRDSVRSF